MARSALVVFTLTLLVTTGCKSFIEQSAMDTTASILTRARVATQQESDVEIAAQAIPASLKTVEGFHVANPDNEDLIAMLAEGWCQYTTGFVQDAYETAQFEGNFERADVLKRRATNLFLRCMNYGLKLLPKKWGDAIYGDMAGVEKLVAKAGKDDVPGLFWTGLGLASSINMNRDDIVMVAHLPKAKLIMERVLELDEDYANGLAHMALGMMHSARGAALGGEPETSKQHFDRIVEITDGKFLLAKVMMARTYAVINQKRDLFRNTLIEVLQTPPSVWPEQRLANELAHVKARRYLQQEQDWF